MKRIVSVILFGVLCLCLIAGCGAKSSSNEKAYDGVIDVDLTKLSSTMVYSEVYNMTNTPEDYIGKVVKVNGTSAVYHDDATGDDYYACLVADAAACCSQGIEYVLSEGDYPSIGQEFVVVGTFDTYMDKGIRYSTLRDATLLA